MKIKWLVLMLVLVFLVGCTKQLSDGEIAKELGQLSEEELKAVLIEDSNALVGQVSKQKIDSAKVEKVSRKLKSVSLKKKIDVANRFGIVLPEILKCTDSDDGENLYIKGSTTGFTPSGVMETRRDECEENKKYLSEYYCEGIELKRSRHFCKRGCNEGVCIINLPPSPEFPLSEELEITPVEISEGYIRVIVPEGYEAYGGKFLEDIKYCFGLVPNFVGIDSYWDGIVAKAYISNDGKSKGYFENGGIFYKRSQENFDLDLNGVITNDPDGFFYRSSPTYCANTHEFTHYVTSHLLLPGWTGEGIAQYSQEFNQAGALSSIECLPNGWNGFDYWETNEERFFSYSDLSGGHDSSTIPGAGPKWYNSAQCFWELFDQKFGGATRKSVFQLLKSKYQGHDDTIVVLVDGVETGVRAFVLDSGEVIDYTKKDSYFLEKVLLKVVNPDELKPLLSVFGFEEGIDYNIN